MSYSFPETKRVELQKLAAASGLPYATILGQHIYDLKGLAQTLSGQLQQAQQKQSDPSEVDKLKRKLQECQAELAAYQQEQAKAAGPDSSATKPEPGSQQLSPLM